jgi:hypothetical protein
LASEHSIEEFFVGQGSQKLKETVKQQFNIELGQINNQYPVGVFNGKVSRETHVFTGGKSAIDLYSIAPGDSFNIFELKAENNVQVGIISELFFYASLIKDLSKGKFKSDFTEIQGLKRVNAFFLTPRLHPLITAKVLDLLNKDTQVSYYKLLYEINSVNFLVS